jgi:hypothetical protein
MAATKAEMVDGAREDPRSGREGDSGAVGIGLARIQEHFPDARGIAIAEVVGRAEFEISDPGISGYCKCILPGEMPETPVPPEALSRPEFELESLAGPGMHNHLAADPRRPDAAGRSRSTDLSSRPFRRPTVCGTRPGM